MEIQSERERNTSSTLIMHVVLFFQKWLVIELQRILESKSLNFRK